MSHRPGPYQESQHRWYLSSRELQAPVGENTWHKNISHCTSYKSSGRCSTCKGSKVGIKLDMERVWEQTDTITIYFMSEMRGRLHLFAVYSLLYWKSAGAEWGLHCLPAANLFPVVRFRRFGAARLGAPPLPGPWGVGGGSRLALWGNVAGTDRGTELLIWRNGTVLLLENFQRC